MTLTDPYPTTLPASGFPEPGFPTTAEPEQLTAWGARLDQAVSGIQRLDPEARAAAEEFALALDSLSRTALTTIVRRLRDDPNGKQLLFELVDDPAVRLLLGMHGIIRLPDPDQADRVRTGLGEDGSAAPSSHGPASVPFFSLASMFSGPQSAHACGCGGADACSCGAC